jgi:hypothetical protein
MLRVAELIDTLKLTRVVGERRAGLFDLESHHSTGPSEFPQEPFPGRVASRRAEGQKRIRNTSPGYERFIDDETGEPLLRKRS